MKTIKLLLPLLAAGALGSVTAVQANLVTGSLWEGVSADATPANVPGTSADVTFSVNSPLSFDSRAAGNGYTIGGFLATGGASILTGSGHASDSMDNTLFEFNGLVTVANGQTFTVTHDDGLTLVIGSQTVINVPGPTAPTTTTVTYTGPSGNLPFELVYGETHGPPAVLQVDLPLQAVPEPTTILAGALLLLPFGTGVIRSLRNRKHAA